MMLTRRSFVKLGVGAAAASLSATALAGCSGGTQASSASASAQSSSSSASANTQTYEIKDEVEDIKVAVLGKDIKIAAIIVASEEGFFDEEKLNVTFETVGDFTAAMNAISSNQLDILPFGSIPTCTFVAQGTENICVIGGTIAEGSECIVLPENKDKYVKLADFDNAKCAYFPMETGHLIMQGLQAEAGTFNKDNWIIMDNANSEMQAVLKGEVDCAFVNSGQGYVAMQQGLVTSMQVGSLRPDFPCCRQTTSTEVMEQKPGALVKFLTAALRGQEFLASNKEKAIQDLCNYSGQPAEYVENVIFSTSEYKTPMIVEMDPYTDAVCEFYGTMKATGNIDANTPYKMEDHVDSTFYKQALDTLLERGENEEFYQDLLAAYEEHNTIGK